VSSTLAVLFTFVSGVLVARVLGPADRGEYGTILLIAQTISGIAALSFFDAALLIARRERVRLREKMTTLVLSALAIGLMTSLMTAFMLPFFELPITAVSWNFTLIFIVLMILANLMTVMFSASDRSEMLFMGSNFARTSSAGFFALAVATVWLLLGSGLAPSLILILFMGSKIPSLALWFHTYRKDFYHSLDHRFAKDSLTTGLSLHLAIVLTLIAGPIDRLFAVGAWSQEMLGNYFVAFSAAGAGFGVITSAITTVFFPFLSGIARSERCEKITQILRLTFIATCGLVAIGTPVLPVLVPLVYGAEFTQAAGMSVGLLFALSTQPLRIIILEASRSLGLGRPAVDMAISSIAVMFIGCGVTGYSTPASIIWAFGLSNLVSTIVGLYHLTRQGDIEINSSLVPKFSDFVFLWLTSTRVLSRQKL